MIPIFFGKIQVTLDGKFDMNRMFPTSDVGNIGNVASQEPLSLYTLQTSPINNKKICRNERLLTAVHITLNQWLSGLCTSIGILNI
jgi:hypothetical protein